MSTAFAASLLVGTIATAQTLDVSSVEAQQRQLEHIIEQVEHMAIQFEAAEIDQRMNDRRNQQESADFASLYLSFLVDSSPGIEVSSDAGSLPMVEIVAALERFSEALTAQDNADLARLNELESMLPAGQELTTPLLDHAGREAYAALQALAIDRE